MHVEVGQRFAGGHLVDLHLRGLADHLMVGLYPGLLRDGALHDRVDPYTIGIAGKIQIPIIGLVPNFGPQIDTLFGQRPHLIEKSPGIVPALAHSLVAQFQTLEFHL